MPALVTLIAVLAACKSGDSAGGAPADNGGGGYVSTGQQIYVDACQRCHGVNREGDYESPALDATRIASLGDQPLQFTIAYGTGKMPGFGGLTPTEVADLINYLRTT